MTENSKRRSFKFVKKMIEFINILNFFIVFVLFICQSQLTLTNQKRSFHTEEYDCIVIVSVEAILYLDDFNLLFGLLFKNFVVDFFYGFLILRDLASHEVIEFKFDEIRNVFFYVYCFRLFDKNFDDGNEFFLHNPRNEITDFIRILNDFHLFNRVCSF